MTIPRNQCIFVGNAGKDPEAQYLPNGTMKASFSIAVSNDYFDNKKGEWTKPDPTWVNLTAFDKVAQKVMANVAKGKPIIVYARYSTSRDKQDEKKVYHNFTVTDIALVAKAGDNNVQASQEDFSGDIPF
jgi:single-strand DNA-binding protein